VRPARHPQPPSQRPERVRVLTDTGKYRFHRRSGSDIVVPLPRKYFYKYLCLSSVFSLWNPKFSAVSCQNLSPEFRASSVVFLDYVRCRGVAPLFSGPLYFRWSRASPDVLRISNFAANWNHRRHAKVAVEQPASAILHRHVRTRKTSPETTAIARGRRTWGDRQRPPTWTTQLRTPSFSFTVVPKVKPIPLLDFSSSFPYPYSNRWILRS
jgi:hypothetical protein